MATLKVTSSKGELSIPLNITGFSLSKSLNVSTAQLRQGEVHRPIRTQGPSLTFTCEWSLAKYDQMEWVTDRIVEHFLLSMKNGLNPPLMSLIYPPQAKVWTGIIEQAPRGDRRFTSKYVRTFTMRLISPNLVKAYSTVEGSSPLAPPSGPVVPDYGEDWYSTRDLRSVMSQSEARRIYSPTTPVSPDAIDR